MLDQRAATFGTDMMVFSRSAMKGRSMGLPLPKMTLAEYMAWETALLDLYERVAEGGGALAVTAPAPPAALGLLADLASRLSAGALYRVVPLTEAQRRVAFVERARRRGFDLDPAVVDYLLDRVPRDNNTVFGLLDRIDRAALSERRRVTIPFLKAHVLR